ncbi:hypothetical protein H2198_000557 [Neophaeococcomyces mojaviensis]|uniref:Uncharacterized protein n=1 Tax=Neophaeococcomyces mojaviensis TaxID=3383035 RepID=A0ACC3AKE5_9EURO|nr:hypothetical protein H2198_000557 [Knufia sp. JES_112]
MLLSFLCIATSIFAAPTPVVAGSNDTSEVTSWLDLPSQPAVSHVSTPATGSDGITQVGGQGNTASETTSTDDSINTNILNNIANNSGNIADNTVNTASNNDGNTVASGNNIGNVNLAVRKMVRFRA